MPTAAIYCRVSTEDQEKEGSSLASQRDYCRRKALDAGYEVPESLIFSEVFSGADKDRPKLNDLRQLIRSHGIDALVCYATDRLARNPIHIAIIAEECEKRGIELIFVSEPLDKTPEGALIRYVKGYAAQIEREKIRERSIRGKKQKAREGTLSFGGPRLFGYSVVNKRRVINDAEAEIIKRIFNFFADEGITLYSAVARLNKEGVPAPAGGRWSENGIYRILTNPAYAGVTYAFRYITVRPRVSRSGKTNTTVRKFRDRSEWIEIPGATPPIISHEIFEAAQEQIKRNRRKSPRTRVHQYLFAGARLRCGTCGRSMTGSVKYKNDKPYLYYRCICNVKTDYYEKCPQPSISLKKVETIVWDALLDILNKPDVLEDIINRRQQHPAADEADEFLIENNIAKTREEEIKYIQLYGKGRISEANFETLIEKVRETREGFEKRLREMRLKRENAERMRVNIGDLKTTAAAYSQALHNADYALKLKAMEALDIRVTYKPDKSFVIDGILPVGVTDFGMPSHSINRNALPFHFVLGLDRHLIMR